MTLEVIITPRARRQIAAAKAWWQQNRDKAPAALRDEIDRILDLIAEQPQIGHRIYRTRRRGARKISLERVRYDIYYEVRRNKLFVLSLWHASRRPPRL